jgi:hypothetical protein
MPDNSAAGPADTGAANSQLSVGALGANRCICSKSTARFPALVEQPGRDAKRPIVVNRREHRSLRTGARGGCTGLRYKEFISLRQS